MRYLTRPLLATVLLAGCTASFAPQANEEMTRRTLAAYELVANVRACADLGTCDKPGDFTRMSDRYVQALTDIDTAALIAGELPGTADRAKAILVQELENCRAAITDLAEAHREGPTLRGDPTPKLSQATCQLAYQGVSAL